MGIVSIGNLEEGMVLKDDVYAPNGRFILGQGTVLRAKYIKMFKIWGVNEADINGVDDQEIILKRVVEEEKQQRAELEVRSYFPEEDLWTPEMRELFDLRVSRESTLLDFPSEYEKEYGKKTEVVILDFDNLSLSRPSLQELLTSQVRLFSLPDIYFKIRDVLNSPVSSAIHIAKVVGTDPSLTVRLLRLVNSSFYGFPSPIQSVSRAVAIVGTNELTTLALAISTMSVFKHIPADLVDMKSFWKHSIMCGIFSRLLAYMKRVPSEERFFLAGLLHDIGRVVLYTKLPQHMTFAIREARTKKIPLLEAERKYLGFDHADLGRMLLQQWNIPEPIRVLVGSHHRPLEAENIEEASIICVADVLANAVRLGTSGNFVVPAPSHDVWEQLELSQGSLESILVQGERQIAEIMKIFLVA
ncbi:MAG: HDOD domain-containing protein [Aminobacterium sp.]|jgi:HD-like signal output (HDOD) protein|uniref:HDOD domain-containing protein n=1 Tax=Aminobacterium sp. TaxID=1872491 RepID=UPI001BCF826D|nr:HDOD domain-containing protein [Aminobacterium sp.]MDD2206401.1 HDOD domain-containing protein [Aminobacterium sp.]MDD3425387.1 HDOD domain-containing protein [Aminobacterium sp.]MDD4228264.1 HDOD domain-containing protein [Aminobacterium sp.]MEA4877288.1 HDOD domain-containing protein [Aminobacterium sp.]